MKIENPKLIPLIRKVPEHDKIMAVKHYENIKSMYPWYINCDIKEWIRNPLYSHMQLPDQFNYFREYDDFIYRCFNYLNGKANKRLVQSVVIPDPMYCPSNIMHIGDNFIYQIQIYSYNAVKLFFRCKEVIETELLITICHELVHSDYILDWRKYNNNLKYMNTVELWVNLRAFKTLVEHEKELLEMFPGVIDMDAIKEGYQEYLKQNKKRKDPIEF